MNIKTLIVSTFTLLLVSTSAYAGGFSNNVGQSVAHSGQAVAHASVAGLKLGASAIAIPLTVVGSIGKASGSAGKSLFEFADSEFPLGEATITKLPSPNDALHHRNHTTEENQQ